jgi:hypothetical protein
MKKPEHPDITIPDDLDAQPSRKGSDKEPQSNPSRKKIMKVILIAIGLALVVSVYLLANREMKISSEKLPDSITSSQRLEVEVLDGVGSMKVAQYLTNVIRSYGFDVVEMKRNSGGVVDKTFLFDRSGNLDEAKKLAEQLGVPQDKVFQKIDRNLYLDITVVIGKDFSQLKAFQSHSERNKR